MGHAGFGAPNDTGNKIPDKVESAEDYIIGVDDILSIYVWKEPDFSVKELIVRSDGKISLPLVNDIEAGGLTPKQLKQRITDRLSEFIQLPNVTVTVLKSMSHSVSVAGQVGKPGSYSFGGPITVLELLARAGGVTEYAKAKDIKIVRKADGKPLQFPFNYKDVIEGRGMEQNIILKTGDIIMVP
jgi:polysaccharide biosynthesis/export protein